MRTTAASTKTPFRIWDDAQRRTSATIPTATGSWEQLRRSASKSAERRRRNGPRRKRRWMPILTHGGSVAAGVVVTLFAVRPTLSRTPVPSRTGVLRLRRQVAGISDRRFDRMAPERSTPSTTAPSAPKPQRKSRGEGFFDIVQKIPEERPSVRSKWKGCACSGFRYEFNVNTLLNRDRYRRIAR